MMEAHVPISIHTEAEIESDAQFPDFGHFVRKRKYSYFPQYLHNFHQNFRTVITVTWPVIEYAMVSIHNVRFGTHGCAL